VVEGAPAAQQASGGEEVHPPGTCIPLTGQGKGQKRKRVLRETIKAEGEMPMSPRGREKGRDSGGTY
jgi:hypothetical protein